MTATRRGSTPKKKRIPRYDTERLALMWASLLVAANLCVFGALEIFIPNRAEFDATPAQLIPVLLVAFLVVAALLVVIGNWMRSDIRRGYTAVLLAVGGLMWIQGSLFLRWGYGEFDGKPINWADFSWQGWVDAPIWLAVLGAAVIFRRRVVRQAAFIFLVLVIAQSGAVVVHAVQGGHGDSEAVDEPTTVPQNVCEVSSGLNIFHIIMDGFQSDVFLELVEEEGLSEELDGFVVYPENVSSASRTVISVPSIFSARIYDGSVSESEFFRSAIQKSFSSYLFRHGFVVNLLPQVPLDMTSYTHYYKRPAAYARPARDRIVRGATYLIDVSMFRQFPHTVKRAIYNDQNWRLGALFSEPPGHQSFYHKAFFADYIRKLSVGVATPAYHFIHLMPPHPPFVTLADGSYAKEALPYTRENYKTEARYIVRLLLEFLKKLRKLEIYDSSIVLVHGDHGLLFPPVVGGRPTTSRMASVSALLLLKPTGAKGPLQYSAAQTTLTDIPATLLGLAGVTHNYPGELITDLDPAKIRDRATVYVTERSAMEPTVHRVMIHGSVYDSTSWHPLELRTLEQKVHPYAWGTVLRFGVSGTGGKYLTHGWSTTSGTVHWNDGKQAEMTFGITPPDRPVAVKITYFPHIVPGKLDRQRIRCSVNGHLAGETTYDSRDTQNLGIVVPAKFLQGDRMVLSFEFPDGVSPRELGEGRDSRALAMGLFELEMMLVPEK
jgi:hypothetical protein